MNGKLLYSKTFNNGEASKTVTLSEEEEAKITALHDVETIRIFRTCMEDAQFLTDNKEACLKIALALFDKRCDKIGALIQKTLGEKLKKA